MPMNERNVELHIGSSPIMLTEFEMRELVAHVRARMNGKNLGWFEYDVTDHILMHLMSRHYKETGVKLWDQ